MVSTKTPEEIQEYLKEIVEHDFDYVLDKLDKIIPIFDKEIPATAFNGRDALLMLKDCQKYLKDIRLALLNLPAEKD